MNRRTALLTAAMLISVLTIPFSAAANSPYPNKPIVIVVPYPAGGGVDNLARMLQEPLAKRLGQPIVIENKGGAAGTIGTAQLARATPDGYTLGLVFDNHATAPAIYKSLPYSVADDFASIIHLVRLPMVLAVPADSPYNNIEDFVAAAKASPGKLTYASPGTGSSNHLAAKLLEETADISLTHVPYRGGAPAMTDLAGGHVDAMFQNLLTTMPFVNSGRLKMIAMATASGSPSAPGIPPISDAFPGFDVFSWMAVVAPQGTPPAILEKLNMEFNQILSDPDVKARLHAAGLEPVGGRAKDLDMLIEESMKKWGDIIKRANITN